VRSTSREKAPARFGRSDVRVLAPVVFWWGVASSEETSWMYSSSEEAMLVGLKAGKCGGTVDSEVVVSG